MHVENVLIVKMGSQLNVFLISVTKFLDLMKHFNFLIIKRSKH